jgi:hypothetical protein
MWVNFRLGDYTYDSNNNLITRIAMNWNGSTWVNSTKTSLTYDINSNLTLSLRQLWQGGNWVNNNRTEYTYDGTILNKNDDIQANLIEEVSQQWNGTEWINTQMQIYIYIPTAVEETKETITNYSLQQNYPNPFNPSTKIKYSVPQSSEVIIKVFDVLGNEIETLVKEEKPTGSYEITWNAANLPSGVYFYRLKADSFIDTKKMILLK